MTSRPARQYTEIFIRVADDPLPNPVGGFGATGGQHLPFPVTLAIGYTSHDKAPIGCSARR